MARLMVLGGALGVTLVSALEDSSALVQVHAGSGTSTGAGAGMMQGRAAMLSEMAAQVGQFPQAMPMMQQFMQGSASMQPVMKSQFNCTAIPWMCKEPFNCHADIDPKRQARRFFQMATDDGHANLRTWCTAMTSKYIPTLVKNCMRDKDLKKSAQAVYDATRRGRFGPLTADMDASYCFIEGHCSNTAVTENTTLEEAEQMCDYRYGHDAWAKNFGFKDVVSTDMSLNLKGVDWINGGFYHTALTKPFLKAACAMGNYHCDVVYCKETYCKEEYYIKKFGHMLPKVPGHLIQQRDYLA